ncbi:helix-turn-helix domain-containing protein [Paenibacillus mesotrionivorans]|uniref:Helix-turn-helix domain-containing protein n=1 Tax=Paenibacillus mesotrionivorans TaxID=3160968 RepID=A0ACC7P3Y5_9BACL
MESIRENIQYQHPFLAVKIFDAVRSCQPYQKVTRWHYHKEIELILMLQGRYGFYLNETPVVLQPGELILIGSNELHTDYPCDNGSYLVFQFDIQEHLENSGLPYYRYFADPSVPLSRLNYIFQENHEVRQTVARCIQSINEEFLAKQDGYEIAISIQIKQIILSLLRADSRKVIPSRENSDIIRLRPVLDYIDIHLSDKLQVEEACKLANMSYHYFVKYFKKTMGISFVDYITLKKIRRAERLLLTKDLSISQIGEEVGMSNMAHFYKMFRKFKACSPNEFRKKMLFDTAGRQEELNPPEAKAPQSFQNFSVCQ